MRDLSVLIPARNETYLRETITDVLAHSHADTEVIAVLDGAWAVPPIPDHPRLRLVHHSVPIGQRAATNLAARISQARYLMKLDAHCAIADNFDVVLLTAAETLGEETTQIPAQYNLHVYDQVCETCGHRTYQAPPLKVCEKCQGPIRRELVWQPRTGRLTTSWRLDLDLHFQYDKAGEKRQTGDICDVMTSLGACFFMSRDRYWQLDGLDEAAGSWGQFGQEIACKSWLSGGRHVVNKMTWFAHFFRVGGIGFPYTITGSDQDRARQYHRDLWFQNRWPKQTRPLAWLIDHFAPATDWHEPHGAEKLAQVRAAGAAFTARPASQAAPAPLRRVIPPRKAVLYYSDSRLEAALRDACQRQLRRATEGLPIVAVTLQPSEFGDVRLCMDAAPSYLTMFQQILAGLEACDADIVYFCEHDCLYPPEHFLFTPPQKTLDYYNRNWWKVDAETGRALRYDANQTSGLCAYRLLLVEQYRTRVARVQAEGRYARSMGFEPGTKTLSRGGFDDVGHDTWFADRPLIDIRHGANLTPSRWSQDQFRNKRSCLGWTEADAVPGWGQTRGRFAAWLDEVTYDGARDGQREEHDGAQRQVLRRG
jgi:glycosyltransferase involved in cell wall biosynthesis